MPSSEDDRVAALIADSNGALWIGHRAGLFVFNPRDERGDRGHTGSRPCPPPPAATRRPTASRTTPSCLIQQSEDGHLWVRTFGRSLTEFDGERFHRYTIGSGVGDIVGALTEDREGNLWLGTTTRGALKVMRDGWTTYDADDDGLGQSVASVFETGAGELYVNSSGWRISRFDGRRFTTVKLRLPPAVTDASWRDVNGVIQDHLGDWWIATRVGLHRYSRVARFEDLGRALPSAVYTMRDGMASDEVTRLFEDARGDIWISSWLPAREPLVRWERATGRFQRYSAADGLRPSPASSRFSRTVPATCGSGYAKGGSSAIGTAISPRSVTTAIWPATA